MQSNPAAFRQMFLSDGMGAAAWEFQQEELSAEFTKMFWSLLLRDDEASPMLQRFVWAMTLKEKRKFIRAIGEHLSDRYPMFKELPEGWPGENGIPPYIRPAEERCQDFALVNTGYLGYMALGYCAARGRAVRLA